MRNTFYTSSSKVFLAFHTRFWEKDLGGEIRGGDTVTDLPIKIVYYPNHVSQSGIGVLLASYTWGRDSARQVGMTDKDLIEETLKEVGKIHKIDLPTIRTYYLKGVVKHWIEDQYTLGAFVTFHAHQVSVQKKLETLSGLQTFLPVSRVPRGPSPAGGKDLLLGRAH